MVGKTPETFCEGDEKAIDLNTSHHDPIGPRVERVVRFGLLFRAIILFSRIEVISAGIRQMTSEELYYWYSKCASRAKAERAQKALRMLLADE